MNKRKFSEKVIISLALEQKLKDDLEKKADELGLTTSTYIRLLIIQSLKD